MNTEAALKIVNEALVAHRRKPLSDLEEAVFQGAWDGLTYQQMEEDSRFPYAEKTLKDAGSVLWKNLSGALKEEVKKTNFKSALERYSSIQLLPIALSLKTYQDWGEAIDVPVFFGRNEELTTLENWILHDRCRLVALVGMGGMGKTAVAVKLVEQIQNEFQYFIWISLRDAPPLIESLNKLIEFLSHGQDVEVDLQDNLDKKFSKLLKHITTSRCLLVFDNVDAILSGGQFTGRYRSGYENYGELFNRIANARHQSCLLLTTREIPKEVRTLEGEILPVRVLQLVGLRQIEAREIFTAQNLPVADLEIESQTLIEHYAGNPLALKIVAKTIRELFDADISKFLGQYSTVFGDIRDLLEQQFDRLSELEQTIMYWLSIVREPVSLSELQENIVPSVPTSKLIEALSSLGQRYLIEKSSASYTQQPVVMEYVTEQLIEQICEEINTEELSLFVKFSIVQASAKDYIRESQIRVILEPIAHRLKAIYEAKQKVVQKLDRVLLKLREEPFLVGYGCGNLINLLHHLQVDLTGYDFSYLTIWEADLRNVDLHRVDFANADLSKSVFAEVLGYTFSVAFSPDGKLLATSEETGRVLVWQFASSKLLFSCLGHLGWVVTVVFSPDGRILASCGCDRTIRVWNAKTGQCLNVLEGHAESVFRIAFSPNSQTLASVSQDHTVRLWDVATGQCLKILQGHTHFIWGIAFNPNGKTLASASFDHTIKLWDVATGECWQTLQGHSDDVLALAFAPEGDLLASGSADKSVRLWNMTTGSCCMVLLGHQDMIHSLSFSPDGYMLASGSMDETIRLWDRASGRCLNILNGRADGVWSVSFHPVKQTTPLPGGTFVTSYLLASGHENRTVKLWNTGTGQSIKTLSGTSGEVQSIVFSPNDLRLASSNLSHVARIWDICTGECIHTLTEHNGLVTQVAFSPDGYTLASASRDGTARLWDVKTGKCLRILQGHAGWVWSAVFGPTNHVLATGSFDKTLKLWDVKTGQCLQTLHGHTSFVRPIAISRNGQIIASGSYDRTVKLWDIHTGECLRTLEGHRAWVASVAFSPDDRLLASAGDDRTVRIWDTHTGQCLQILEDFPNTILSVSFSPNNSTLATGCMGRPAQIWSVGTGQHLKTLERESPDNSRIAFSSNGRVLAAGRRDEAIDLWDVETGKHLKMLRPTRLYEGTNITGAIGLSEAQRVTLKTLGAIEA